MLRIALLASMGGVLLAGSVVPATVATAPHPPRPGSINYVEGQAILGALPLDASCIGTLEVERNQTVTTQAGKVEILLTPGVFLRLADNSSVTMISPDLANVEVRLDKGRALVEVIDIRKENDIQIDQYGAKTKLLKKGLYSFDADRQEVLIFTGSAEVSAGKPKLTLTAKEKAALGGDGLKAQHVETAQYEDEFYRWNGLRSGYLAEASVYAARGYAGTDLGWYWNPWFTVYTFLPGEGVFYGPFGWAFYSPMEVYRSPFLFRGNSPHTFAEFHDPYGHGFPPPAGRGGRIGR